MINRILHSILIALLLSVITPLQAQIVTKEFRQSSLASVLHEIERQTGYSIVYKPSDFLGKDKVSVSFKKVKLETVLNKVFVLRGLPYKIQNRTIIVGTSALRNSQKTEKQAENPPIKVEKEVPKTEIVWHDSTIISYETKQVIDTISVDSIFKQKCDTTLLPPRHPRKGKGSYVQVTIGGGYGVLKQIVKETYPIGAWHANAQLGYSYFFRPSWGVGSGIGLASYQSSYVLNYTTVEYHQKDSEGEFYDHIAATSDRKEVRKSLFIEIPLALQFRHNLNEKIALWASIGGKVGLPVYANYTVTSGTIHNKGYYPQWNLTLENLPGRFEDEILAGESGVFDLNFSYGGFAEVGCLVDFGKRTELMVTTFGNYSTENYAIGVRIGVNLQLDKMKSIRKTNCRDLFDFVKADTTYKEVKVEHRNSIQVPVIIRK